MVDPCIGIAARALPKLDALIKVKFIEWLSSPGEIVRNDEELFYDSTTGDVYVAITLTTEINSKEVRKEFVACIPVIGDISILTVDTLIEKNLDDISHLVNQIMQKMIENERLDREIKTLMQTSILIDGGVLDCRNKG